MKEPISIVENIDCMEGMKRFPDKYFDLAVVDVPYGIKRGETFGGKNWKKHLKKGWDNNTPGADYFNELFRVSNNQIIWGANYLTKHLPASMGWIVWDKGQDLTMSDGELAYSSFERALRIIEFNRCYIQEYGGNIHPTQKPVKLYTWLLQNYAKPGDKILDTHLGSQSSRIAAYKLGFDFWGYETDEMYFKEGNERFAKAIAEPLFDAVKEKQQAIMMFNSNEPNGY